MKRSRFSEEQIIGILKEHEAGMATVDVCRRHGISSATFYKWKSKYGGLEVSVSVRLGVVKDSAATNQHLEPGPELAQTRPPRPRGEIGFACGMFPQPPFLDFEIAPLAGPMDLAVADYVV